MTRKRHTEEQIIAAQGCLSGHGGPELCRKHGISDATCYKWRAKHAGLEVIDVKKLCQLEDENRRLKQRVAEQALDIQALLVGDRDPRQRTIGGKQARRADRSLLCRRNGHSARIGPHPPMVFHGL
jgi:putative transposase